MSRVSLVLFFVLAAADWVAVVRGEKRLEYFAKPATLVALIAYAASGANPSGWLIAALGLSLVGDIFLMLPVDRFIAGLGAFLLAHLGYIAAFAAPARARVLWWILLIVVSTPLATPILRGAGRQVSRGAIGAYLGVITLMVASAIASGRPSGGAGALLFLASDSLIAWNRFVRAVPHAEPMIMITYHLGQLLLVVALRSG